MATAKSSGSSGIVHEALTKENYDNWSTLVQNYLQGEGLWSVVNLNPESGGKIKENEIWKRKNAKALHIIQLACGSEVLSNIRGVGSAKDAWNTLSALYNSKLKADNWKVDPDLETGEGDGFLQMYVENDMWNEAKAMMNKDKMLIYSTSASKKTILHVAVIAGHNHIVKSLVNMGKKKLAKMQDKRGYTALALAAELTGNTDTAKIMVEMKSGGGEDLLTMMNHNNEIPVLLAAAKGHKSMTRYLYQQTPIHAFVGKNLPQASLLLTRCITAQIFDVALMLIHQTPEFPLSGNDMLSGDIGPLYALADLPSAFPSGSGYGFLKKLVYKVLILKPIELELQDFISGNPIRIVVDAAQVQGRHETSFLGRQLIFIQQFFQKYIFRLSPAIKDIYKKKKTHCLVREILTRLSQRIATYKEHELRQASAYDAMLQAAKLGVIEFIHAMMKDKPHLLLGATDKNKRGVFSHAVLNRRKEVLELLERVSGRKDMIKCSEDEFGNTLLHLAGYSGPSSEFNSKSGAFLQMQREIQWFKKVKRIAHPKCKETKNKDDKKPREIFTENHNEMVKDGEKWAKDTASSFTLVGTLITTIMFAAAFTVPGGNNQNTGIPMFVGDTIFTLFIIADAISLFTSATSVLIFIGILTSRYAEKDFYKTLPLKLLCALVFLFFSVVFMMITFCAALGMMLNGYRRVIIAAMSLASIPVIVLVPAQLRLIFKIFISTLRSGY